MDRPLRLGEWIDPGLPKPLHTVADVDEVFRMVEKLKAERLLREEAERRASRT